MKRKMLSDEEKEILLKSPYVIEIDDRDFVHVSEQFKITFSELYEKGVKPVEILNELGIPSKIIGEKRKNGYIRRYGHYKKNKDDIASITEKKRNIRLDFIDKKHKNRFDCLYAKCNDEDNDIECLVLAYMLSINQTIFDKTIKYFDENGFTFGRLYAGQDLTEASIFYIQVAESMFKWKTIPLNLSNLRLLDYPYLFGLVNGIKIYTGFDKAKKGYKILQKVLDEEHIE